MTKHTENAIYTYTFQSDDIIDRTQFLRGHNVEEAFDNWRTETLNAVDDEDNLKAILDELMLTDWCYEPPNDFLGYTNGRTGFSVVPVDWENDEEIKLLNKAEKIDGVTGPEDPNTLYTWELSNMHFTGRGHTAMQAFEIWLEDEIEGYDSDPENEDDSPLENLKLDQYDADTRGEKWAKYYNEDMGGVIVELLELSKVKQNSSVKRSARKPDLDLGM